ncbi:MAG: transcriptional regulator [Hyphomicrobiales bacterium]|nr:MAG: transcriptional regulator [Hyphomicrobiales bacterium]
MRNPITDRGSRIRHAMGLRGFSKTLALATELDVSVASVSKWQNGGPISLESACVLADFLDVSLDWLLLARGDPDWHNNNSISQVELDWALELRKRSEDIRILFQALLKAVPPEKNSPSG